jgi:hypothetical protein
MCKALRSILSTENKTKQTKLKMKQIAFLQQNFGKGFEYARLI